MIAAQSGKGKRGETSRGESYFKPHSSSNPHSRGDPVPGESQESQSGCASCALLAPTRDTRPQPTERTPPSPPLGTPALVGTRRPASPEAPSLIRRPLPTSLEVGGAGPGLQRQSRPTRPSASFLTLRLAEDIQPLFNGLEAHITHPRPSGVKNETAEA